MNARKIKLGSKIRQFRKARRMSLKTMADRAAIAQSTLSKIENDIISPGFDKVMAICHSLEIDITDLLQSANRPDRGDQQPAARLAVTRKGDMTSIITDNYLSNYVCSSISKKIMIPLIVDLKIRDGEEEGVELIRHQGEEFAYVLEGRVKLVLEHYEPVYLEEGDSAYFDSSMGHLYVNAGTGAARMIGVSLAMDED